MKNLTHEQALAMLQHQEELNVLADPVWKKSQTQWLRAAWVEAAKLVEPRDKDALVNIWGFMLSEWLQNVPSDETTVDAAGLLISVMYDTEKGGPALAQGLQDRTDVHLLIDTFVHLSSAGIFNVIVFERILELFGMSWDQLYERYMPPQQPTEN